jgi:hypothetical protein
MPKRNEEFSLDPRVFNHRGIDLFGMHRPERCSGMPHLADLFSTRPNNKEDTDLQCLRNSHSSLAHGQMLNNFNREAAPIVVSIAVVRTTLSRIVHGPGSLIKGKVRIRITRTRARGQ